MNGGAVPNFSPLAKEAWTDFTELVPTEAFRRLRHILLFAPGHSPVYVQVMATRDESLEVCIGRLGPDLRMSKPGVRIVMDFASREIWPVEEAMDPIWTFFRSPIAVMQQSAMNTRRSFNDLYSYLHVLNQSGYMVWLPRDVTVQGG